jgi:hypothetical protein
MCTVEKPFLFLQAGRSVPLLFFSILAFIVIMTVLANKLDGRHPEDLGYTIDGLGDVGGDYIHRLYPAEALRSTVRRREIAEQGADAHAAAKRAPQRVLDLEDQRKAVHGVDV